jgi:hypothetical protein
VVIADAGALALFDLTQKARDVIARGVALAKEGRREKGEPGDKNSARRNTG